MNFIVNLLKGVVTSMLTGDKKKEPVKNLDNEPANKIVNTNNFFGREADSSPGDDASDVFTPDPLVSASGGSIPPVVPVVPLLEGAGPVPAGFDGILVEIGRINRNIDAIRNALLESATIESEYRKDIIGDLEEDIAERGKDRSGRRNERRKHNFFERTGKDLKENVKGVLNPLKNAGLLGVGLELAALLGNMGGGDKKKEMEKGGIIKGPKTGYPMTIGGVNVTMHGTELVRPTKQGVQIIPLDNFATDGISGNEVTGGGDLNSNITAEKGAVIPTPVNIMKSFMGITGDQSHNITNILSSGNFTQLQNVALQASKVFTEVVNRIDREIPSDSLVREILLDLRKSSPSKSDDEAIVSTHAGNMVPSKSVGIGEWQGYLAGGEI